MIQQIIFVLSVEISKSRHTKYKKEHNKLSIEYGCNVWDSYTDENIKVHRQVARYGMLVTDITTPALCLW